MIVQILRAAHGLDVSLSRKLGPVYHAVLGIGLVAEIAQHVREFGELPSFGAGAVRAILALVLFALLLLHQLGELAEHADRRRKARIT